MARSTSFRLPEDLLNQLEQVAVARGTSTTSLVTTMLDEGLRSRQFPGIVFRDGPAGRRAGLVNGPDVWEIVRDLRAAPGHGMERIELVAEETGLPTRAVTLAADYYTAHPDEIDRLVAVDEQAAEEARRRIDLREQLLAS